MVDSAVMSNADQSAMLLYLINPVSYENRTFEAGFIHSFMDLNVTVKVVFYLKY